VAQGKYYSSGHPSYDAFFLELYELQVRMGKAPIEHTEIRDALASELGLAPNLTDEVLMDKLREQAEVQRRNGARLLLVVRSEDGDLMPPDDAAHSSSATLLVDGASRDETVLHLKRACEKAANAWLIFRQTLARDLGTLEKLAVRVIELEGRVDATFGPEGIAKAAEVDDNLSDAGKIITLMRARASELLDTSGRLLASLFTATNTDDGRLKAGTEKKPEPEVHADDDEPAEPKKPPVKRRATPKRRRQPRPAPKPAEPEFEP
jgi:hypothetical protein